jgi:hypothetical protein
MTKNRVRFTNFLRQLGEDFTDSMGTKHGRMPSLDPQHGCNANNCQLKRGLAASMPNGYYRESQCRLVARMAADKPCAIKHIASKTTRHSVNGFRIAPRLN